MHSSNIIKMIMQINCFYNDLHSKYYHIFFPCRLNAFFSFLIENEKIYIYYEFFHNSDYMIYIFTYIQ